MPHLHIKKIAAILLLSTPMLMAGCSHQGKQTANLGATDISTTTSTIADKKLAALLNDSAKTNNATAIAQLIKKIAQDPNNPELLYTLGYAHMQSAKTQNSLHEHDLALSYLNRSLELVPGNPIVLRALYNIYYDDTLHQRAVDAPEKAKSIFVQFSDENKKDMNPPALARYIVEYNRQEKSTVPDKQLLRDILLQGMQEQPFNDNIYIYLAKLYALDHYFALALATLKLGAENINDSVDLYRAIASTYEKRADVNGCSYEHPDDIKQAAQFYKQAIAINPDDQQLHQFLSQSFFDLNLSRLGINEALIANNLENSKYNLSATAQNYSMLGQHQQAVSFLQKANTLGFDASSPIYHEVYMNQGDWQKASQAFSAYVKGLEKFSVYDLIKSDIIAQQTHQPSQITNQKITLNSAWEEKLFKYWTAKLTEASLKKEAINICEKTEYYFYTGYRNYEDGDVSTAKIKFKEALNQNTYRFIERPLARYFLQK